MLQAPNVSTEQTHIDNTWKESTNNIEFDSNLKCSEIRSRSCILYFSVSVSSFLFFAVIRNQTHTNIHNTSRFQLLNRIYMCGAECASFVCTFSSGYFIVSFGVCRYTV